MDVLVCVFICEELFFEGFNLFEIEFLIYCIINKIDEYFWLNEIIKFCLVLNDKFFWRGVLVEIK